MNDLSLQQILFRVAALLLIGAIHGFVLAAAARLMGDRGVSYDEKLTLNPLTHLSMPAVVAVVLARVGWIRPIEIDPAALRTGRGGLVLAALAAIIATLGLAVLLMALRRPALLLLPEVLTFGTAVWLQVTAETAVVFAIVNLLPFPPFTGRLFLQAAAPAAYASARRVETWIAIAIAALCITGIVATALRPVTAPVIAFLLG